MRWKFLIGGIAGLALASNGIGLLIGQLSSPRYDDEIGAVAYLHSEVSYIISEKGLSRLELKSGLRRYVYDVSSEKLEVTLRNVGELSTLKRPRNRLLELGRLERYLGLSALIPTSAGTAAIALRNAAKEPPLLKIARGGSRSIGLRVALPTLVVSGTAGYFGYRWGYNDTADWDNKAIRSVLSNPEYYQNVADSYTFCDISAGVHSDGIYGVSNSLISKLGLFDAISAFEDRDRYPRIEVIQVPKDDPEPTHRDSGENNLETREGKIDIPLSIVDAYQLTDELQNYLVSMRDYCNGLEEFVGEFPDETLLDRLQ